MARAQYYQAGYTPPAGVNSATGVKEYQRMLGVDVDGIWGQRPRLPMTNIWPAKYPDQQRQLALGRPGQPRRFQPGRHRPV